MALQLVQHLSISHNIIVNKGIPSLLYYTAPQDYLNIRSVYLNFSSGVQRQDVVVTIVDDDMFEVNEMFKVIMSVLTTGDAIVYISTPMATVKIINNDCKPEKNNFPVSKL